jgi:predicted DNA-binding protein YlxM (UPF0122 family)
LKEGGFIVAKNFEVVLLLDFYGDMLTVKQKDFLGYYYNDDLSLSEIAENEGITRQGVRDSIKRAEAQLFEMEERLGLAKRFEQVRQGLEDIEFAAERINQVNLNGAQSRDINDSIVKIKSTVSSLME